MANLLESYKGRLAVSDKYYAANHDGKRMPMREKMLTAAMLSNTAKFLNEAFTNQVGTQRADMGKFKQFCLDITTLVMPNLIVNDIFMVKEMSSRTGWLTYTSFSLGTAKGSVGGAQAEPYGAAIDPYTGRRDGNGVWGTWNTPINDYRHGFGAINEDRVNYTGAKVVETLSAEQKGALTTGITVAWTPVIATTAKLLDANNKVLEAVAEAVQGTKDQIKFTGTTDGAVKVAYEYDNAYIPAAQLPTVVAHMEGIPLEAKIRRIAIYYDMLASYQAKQDYGTDFESQINQQAKSELQFEIDNQAVLLLKDGVLGMTDAGGSIMPAAHAKVWEDTDPQAVSYSMKAEGFAKTLEEAKMAVYKTTNRYMPNFMLISPDVLPILNFVPGFKAANYSVANGPFLAGTISNMKVFVSPALNGEMPAITAAESETYKGKTPKGLCILGLNAGDGKVATGIYAPYMPIVPTQLLQFADGANSQGFATMYDMKLLNANLLACIKVVDGDRMLQVETHTGA